FEERRKRLSLSSHRPARSFADPLDVSPEPSYSARERSAMKYAIKYQPESRYLTKPDGTLLTFDDEEEAKGKAIALIAGMGCGQPLIERHVTQADVVRCARPCYVVEEIKDSQ